MSRVRVILFGTSFGRLVQAAGFSRHGGFELVGIAGRDEAKTRTAADELGIPNASSDWRALLASVEADLVSIVTPVDLHHPMMMAAVAAGRHVLCEKPTALHRFQAAEMRDAARAADRVAAINHEFRFFPARLTAVDLVRAGGIGVPRRGEILGRYPIWPLPESRGMTWLSDARRGGGILGALGSHHVDCLRLFLGEPEWATASVRIAQPRRGPTAADASAAIATADDACTLHLEFGGGVTALVDLDATAPYRWERFEIHGSEASLRWDETGYRLWRLVAGRDPEEVPIPAAHRLEPRAGDPALLAPFGVLVDRLHRAIVSGEPMEPNFDDAVAVQSVLDAARISSDAEVHTRVVNPTAPVPAAGVAAGVVPAR